MNDFGPYYYYVDYNYSYPMQVKLEMNLGPQTPDVEVNVQVLSYRGCIEH